MNLSLREAVLNGALHRTCVCVCVRALHADVPSARSHSLQPGSCWRFASFPDEALLPPAAQAAVMARLP